MCYILDHADQSNFGREIGTKVWLQWLQGGKELETSNLANIF